MQGQRRWVGILGVGAVAALVAACGSKSGAGEGGSAGATGTTSATSTTGTTDAGAGGSVGHGGAAGSGTGGAGGTTTTSVPDTDGGTAGPCPTTGAGAIKTPGATCLVFPPTVTGASAAGENAANVNYAIAPDSGANGQLVLFLNGSGGHPSEQIASPTESFYGAAAGLGYHVLAVSYRSNETIAEQCVCADACYFPSRQTVITGTLEPGASPDLQSPLMRVDESIAGRAALALQWLVANDPTHGWDAFLTSASASAPPDTQIDWPKVVAAGHSQGGGHAAAIGKLYPVARVVQLSATCDAALSTANCSHAADPSLATPATWTSRENGTWQTPASVFWGLDIKTVFSGGAWASGDGTCYLHAAIWQNEGLLAAMQNDGAAICTATTSVENHDASIACAQNFANWQAMLK
jgi:hypothetical protein